MGIISSASGKSVWRGLNYYKINKINGYKKISDFEYEGKAKSSNNEVYNVFLNIEHPKKSSCDCPHAKDRRVICQHIVALYFTIFPSEVNVFLKEVEEAQKEYEEYEKELYNKTIKYIKTMNKKDLQDTLIDILDLAPEWVYDKFVRDYIGFN